MMSHGGGDKANGRKWVQHDPEKGFDFLQVVPMRHRSLLSPGAIIYFSQSGSEQSEGSALICSCLWSSPLWGPKQVSTEGHTYLTQIICSFVILTATQYNPLFLKIALHIWQACITFEKDELYPTFCSGPPIHVISHSSVYFHLTTWSERLLWLVLIQKPRVSREAWLCSYRV